MKKIFIVVFGVLSIIHLYGQNKTMHHLFNDQHDGLSYYINPIGQFCQIGDAKTIVPGIGAGVYINKNIAAGVVYNLSLTDIAISNNQNIKSQWGGIHFEYILLPDQTVHLTIPLSVGMGKGELTTPDNITTSSTFGYVEPGFLIEANVWKYAKFGIGAQYRYIANNSGSSVATNELKGFSAVASLKLGKFNIRKKSPHNAARNARLTEKKNEKELKELQK